MTEREFIYWLQGFLELADPETITADQVQSIKDHMKLVLTKVTPDCKEDQQEKLKRSLTPLLPHGTRRIC